VSHHSVALAIKMSTAHALSTTADWKTYDNLRRKFFSTTLKDYDSVELTMVPLYSSCSQDYNR